MAISAELTKSGSLFMAITPAARCLPEESYGLFTFLIIVVSKPQDKEIMHTEGVINSALFCQRIQLCKNVAMTPIIFPSGLLVSIVKLKTKFKSLLHNGKSQVSFMLFSSFCFSLLVSFYNEL